MNSVKFKDTWFNIPGDGIGCNDEIVSLTVIANGTTVDEMEELVTPVPEVIEIYDEDRETKTGEFVGFTNLKMIAKNLNQKIYDTEEREDTITVQFAVPDLYQRMDANEAQTFYTAMMTDTLLEGEE